jgi:hypothetical protein
MSRGRPHASLEPEIPDASPEISELVSNGHRLPEHVHVVATPILAGLHHELSPGARRGLTGHNATLD